MNIESISSEKIKENKSSNTSSSNETNENASFSEEYQLLLAQSNLGQSQLINYDVNLNKTNSGSGLISFDGLIKNSFNVITCFDNIIPII